MKKSELFKALSHIWNDGEIVVVLKQGGVGGTPCTTITTISQGFDWDNGKILLGTEKPVVTVEHLERLQKYSRLFEKLLYLYAVENGNEFMGKPLMGHKMSVKGSAARAFKRMMKENVEEYLKG